MTDQEFFDALKEYAQFKEPSGDNAAYFQIGYLRSLVSHLIKTDEQRASLHSRIQDFRDEMNA